MEIIKHGDHFYDVKFYQLCPNCGAEILYYIYDQVSMPETDGVFCPECMNFLDHDKSQRILAWLNRDDNAAAAGGTETR